MGGVREGEGGWNRRRHHHLHLLQQLQPDQGPGCHTGGGTTRQVRWSVCLSVCLSICLSVCLSVCLSIFRVSTGGVREGEGGWSRRRHHLLLLLLQKVQLHQRPGYRAGGGTTRAREMVCLAGCQSLVCAWMRVRDREGKGRGGGDGWR